MASFLKKLIGVAAPIVGSIIAPGVGTMVGGAIGKMVSGAGEPSGPMPDGSNLSSGSSGGGTDWGGVASAGISGAAQLFGGYEQRSSAKAATDLAYGRDVEQSQIQRDWASKEAATARQFEELQAQKQMDFQTSSNAKQMAFQQQMSETSHQREVADLRAAGLNPILSGTGGMGASTPSGASSAGAMAHATAPSGSKATAPTQQIFDLVGPAISTALNVANTQSQISRMEAETKNIGSEMSYRDTYQTAETDARIANLAVDTGLKSAQQSLTVGQTDRIKVEVQGIIAKAKHDLAAATRELSSSRNLDEETRSRRVNAAADEWGESYGIPKIERALKAAGLGTDVVKSIAESIWAVAKPKITIGGPKLNGRNTGSSMYGEK